MRSMPRERSFDSTLQLLSNPYGYIRARCSHFDSDAFETRILLKKTICMTGPLAAEIFYDSKRFQRHGAAPEPLLATLFGKKGVQTLDGTSHRGRKALFMRILHPDKVADLAQLTGQQWEAQASRWPEATPVALYGAAHDVLTRAVCDWACVPLSEDEAPKRTRDLVSLFDDAAKGFVPHLRSRWARRRSEDWLEQRIMAVRSGQIEATAGSALYEVANHRDVDGDLLDSHDAAVELLNVLRPTVAVSVFIVLAAHALYTSPVCRTRLRSGDRQYLQWFLQEVRRFYPFFPAVLARVRQDFDWRDFHFREGQAAILDIFGTNHDSRTWHAPEQFEPERFRDFNPGPFEFVPQGGGRPSVDHRCPGEGVALALMEVSIDFLVHRLSYSPVLASQDMRIDDKRLPALPCGPFLVTLGNRAEEH